MDKPQVVGIDSKLLYKIYTYLKDKFDPTYPTTEEEIICLKICMNLIGNPNSQLTVSPISYKRYIKNDDLQIFVIIYNRQITLINHVYCYNILIEGDEVYENIVTKFDYVLENRRQELENEMKENVKKSLQNILDDIIDFPSTP